MEYTYEEVPTPIGEKMIVRSDGAWIPTDPANSDYQAYLNPEAALSTPIVSGDE